MPTHSAIERFRALHRTGTFVMPNPWDRGSAQFLAQLGFEAIATTSAGYAFSRGKPDAVDALTLDEVLAHVQDMVEAIDLPVNADFQHGYATDPDAVAENVAACLETGAAGLSIEDATGNPDAPLFERELAIERIDAACAARDEISPSAVITARCEAYLVDDPDAERTVLDRLAAFARAGADCLFAPGVTDVGSIERIVQTVSPHAVNVLVAAPSPELTVARLADLGVRRISVGSALARVVWGAVMRAARGIAEGGTFDALEGAASFTELNELFGAR